MQQMRGACSRCQAAAACCFPRYLEQVVVAFAAAMQHAQQHRLHPHPRLQQVPGNCTLLLPVPVEQLQNLEPQHAQQHWLHPHTRLQQVPGMPLVPVPGAPRLSF